MLGFAPIAALPLAGSVTADGSAAGAIVTATITVLAGAATGVSAGSGPSISLPGYFVAKPAKTTIDAQARGRTVVCKVTLLAGRASSASLLAGKAAGSASARARPMLIKTVLSAGNATGERNWSDDELLILAMAA